MQKYKFDQSMLNLKNRKDGFSAFMRIKNGGEFLEECIESHIYFFDEIVAVYNGCTDNTAEILEKLKQKYPAKLKVYHYEPVVYPVGSEKHFELPEDSVHSIVNYSNFALSRTSYKTVMKLDDDHIAILENFRKLMDYIKKHGVKNRLLCLSGINLLFSNDGKLGVYENNPFVGSGDHQIFDVSEKTYYVKYHRYELLKTLYKRRYFGLVWVHCKFLKQGYGFDNYNFKDNPNSEYVKHFENFKKSAKWQTWEDFVKLRSNVCNMSPFIDRKAKLVEKIPLKLLKFFSGIGFFAKNIEISRAIKFTDDLKDVKLLDLKI